MSDATYDAMEEAIRAHVLDATEGGYMAGWVLTAAAVPPSEPDSSHYLYANHEGAPHEWLGLLRMAVRRAERLDL